MRGFGPKIWRALKRDPEIRKMLAKQLASDLADDLSLQNFIDSQRQSMFDAQVRPQHAMSCTYMCMPPRCGSLATEASSCLSWHTWTARNASRTLHDYICGFRKHPIQSRCNKVFVALCVEVRMTKSVSKVTIAVQGRLRENCDTCSV